MINGAICQLVVELSSPPTCAIHQPKASEQLSSYQLVLQSTHRNIWNTHKVLKVKEILKYSYVYANKTGTIKDYTTHVAKKNTNQAILAGQ